MSASDQLSHSKTQLMHSWSHALMVFQAELVESHVLGLASGTCQAVPDVAGGHLLAATGLQHAPQ
jgi:hypothetical protein